MSPTDAETRKWPEIELLPTILRDLQKHHEAGGPKPPTVAYSEKVKLDGTQDSARFRNGVIEAFQSRDRDITPADDNAGFARWASGVTWPTFEANESFPVTLIHGEWAGPGVIKGTAVAKIPKKQFFIFAIERCSAEKDPETGDWTHRVLITNPRDIENWLDGWTHPDVHILPWANAGKQWVVDLNDPERVSTFAAIINERVATIETEDPYISETFGVKGVGEGLVLYPTYVWTDQGDGFCTNRESWRRLAFKAKGEKHREQKAPVAVEVAPEALADVAAFVASFVTEARCRHGLRDACGGEASPKKTGAFIGWIGKDVEKESRVALEANRLSRKQVQGPVTTAARLWFQAEQGRQAGLP